MLLKLNGSHPFMRGPMEPRLDDIVGKAGWGIVAVWEDDEGEGNAWLTSAAHSIDITGNLSNASDLCA